MKLKVLLLTTLFLAAGAMNKAFSQTPTSNFSLSTIAPCVNAPVLITDLSSDSPTAWSYSLNGIPYTTLQNSSISFTVAGTYTLSLEASNINGEGTLASYTLLALPLPTVTISGGNALCLGSSITLSASGADTYTWNLGSNLNAVTYTPLVNSSYVVEGTNTLTGCTQSVSTAITVYSLPTLSVNSGSLCLGSTFTLVPSGALSYTFSTGSNTITPLGNSNYTISGSDVNGCINTAISELTVIPLPSITVNSGTTCAGSEFVILPSGGLTYTFSSGSNTVNPLSTTNYVILGEDYNGCINIAISSVTVFALPFVSVNSGSICEGETFVMVPGGAAFYKFSNLTATVSPIVNTSYTISGESVEGCLSSNTVISTVTVNPLPVVSISSGSVCYGSSFLLTPTGASTYLFAGNTATVSPLSTSSYSVKGISAEGCISANAAVATITVHALPVISVTSGSICAGDIYVMSPSGAASYTFSSGSATVNPVSSTVYSVSGTSNEGCVSSVSAVSDITVVALPLVSVNSGSICEGETFVMIPSGAATYTFSNGTATVNPLVSSSYTVSGTSVEGCLSANLAISDLTVNLVPTVSVNSGSICEGTIFSMVPAGAFTYSYSSGSFTVSPVTNTSYSVTGISAEGCLSSNSAVSDVTVVISPVVAVNSGSVCAGDPFVIIPSGAITYIVIGGTTTVTPLTSTSYSVLGTGTDGCVSAIAAISSITVGALPVVSVNNGSICEGQTFVMIPSGAASYTFSNGTATVSPLTSTSYSLTGTSAVGCLSSNTAVSTVTVNLIPILSVNSGTVCSGNSFLMMPSGAGTYSFSSGSAAVSPLVNSSYTVTGTSVQGCAAALSVVSSVTVLALPVVAISGSSAVCSGSSTTLTASGALSYLWYNNVTSLTLQVTPSGNTLYNVTGTDINGCMGLAFYGVSVHVLPVLAVNSGSICQGSSFTLIPTGALTYTFSGGSNVVSPVISTSYSITGTDNKGCVSPLATVANITVFASPVITVNSGSICAGNVFTITPIGAATFTVSGGMYVISPNATSHYTVSGTSSKGCVSLNSAVSQVVVNQLPLVLAVSSSSAICSGENASITASGANSYFWSTGSSSVSILVSPAVTTSYTVTGTDLNGCINSANILQKVNTCTGLSKNTTGGQQLVYPNPNKGEFFIESEQNVSMNIINAMGQVIFSQDLYQGKNLIDLNNQPDGIYFIRVVMNGHITHTKVIKN